tara:strand:+ start:1180 stop:2805 length:1626 start_codon:yes stop_codon:yes gene_type:complete
MNHLSQKIFTKIYRDYGLKFYPQSFKKNFDLKQKYKSYDISFRNNKTNFSIDLASITLTLNPNNIWKKKLFKDREDFSSLHRWSWAIKLISKKKNIIEFKEKKFIEDCILNWCYKYQTSKIEKNDIIFEPYNISERICNYLILLKLKIIRPNNFVLYNLEKQFFFLLKNIEYYKFRLSNHALNNLRAIYLFSVFLKNKKIQKYSLEFINYLLKNYLDENYFFKFGSSNYQFIFSKWLLDIFLFSKNGDKKKLLKNKKRLSKVFNTLHFFSEIGNNKNRKIPLFGNISPDFENDWLINFFFKKKDNIFFKSYWKKINFSIDKKVIRSKEWFKLKNQKFCIFSRNPKLVGFEFNHSHNDFFNFIFFCYGKEIIIDPGRKNYSFESLKNDVSGKSHNSIIINNKAIYDDYLFYNVLYKLGFKNLNNCNYLVKTNYKNFIQLKSIEKDFTVLRKIYLKKNYIEIIDNVLTKKNSNIKLKFNFNMNSEKLKSFIQKNIVHKSIIKNSKKIQKNFFHRSYGAEFEGSSLVIEFKNTNKIESNLIVKG